MSRTGMSNLIIFNKFYFIYKAICLELSFLNRLYLADEPNTFIYTRKLNDQVVLKFG